MIRDYAFFPVALQELKELLRACVREEMREQKNPAVKASMELITSQEAAKILRISLPTLRKYVREGHIKAHRIKNTIRFRRDQVEAALVSIKTIKHSRSIDTQ